MKFENEKKSSKNSYILDHFKNTKISCCCCFN